MVRLTPMTTRSGTRRLQSKNYRQQAMYMLGSQMRGLWTISVSRHNGRGPDSSLKREFIFVWNRVQRRLLLGTVTHSTDNRRGSCAPINRSSSEIYILGHRKEKGPTSSTHVVRNNRHTPLLVIGREDDCDGLLAVYTRCDLPNSL